MPQRRRSNIALRPGDVIRVWDRGTNPEKQKRHICICPERQMFFRINSRLVFTPAFQLREEDCAFVEHDSWVELTQMVRGHGPDIRQSEHLGRLTEAVATGLLAAVDAARTLTPDQKRFIRERFTGPDGPAAPSP